MTGHRISYAGAGNPATTTPVITTFGVRTADGGYDWGAWVDIAWVGFIDSDRF